MNFVATVAAPTRIFTNRILNFFRGMPAYGHVTLTEEFQADVKFFQDLLPLYNGISILQKSEFDKHDAVELNACLMGCGGMFGDQLYSHPFPEDVMEKDHHISRLKLLNVVVAVKLWAQGWAGHRVRIYCDDVAACWALQTGRVTDPFMQHSVLCNV